MARKTMLRCLSLTAALVLGCDRGDGGNCSVSDCRTDDDCRGNRVCRSDLILGRVCIAPGAETCNLGSFGRGAGILDHDDGYGPVTELPPTEQPADGSSASDVR